MKFLFSNKIFDSKIDVRDDVIKFIDLMKIENWKTKTIDSSGICFGYAPSDKKFPAIPLDGSYILFEDGMLYLSDEERAYFCGVRGEINRKYLNKEKSRLEEKLNNFIKNEK